MGLTFVCKNKQPTPVKFRDLPNGDYFVRYLDGAFVWQKRGDLKASDLTDDHSEPFAEAQLVYPVTLDPITYRHKGADDER